MTTGSGKTLKTQTLTTRYTYDNLGNLLKVVLPNNKVIEYIIDGQNHRVAKKINGVVNMGYLYNLSGQLVAELDASNRITKQLVYVSKSNSPDYLIYNTKNYRLVTDQVGTPTMIVDSTTGKVVTDYNYDEFGEQLSMRGTLDTSIGFAGGLYDKDTGLVRFGARDYDPETGRWTSKDPIGFGGGDTNLYGYVAEDPINGIDPSGLSRLVYDGSSSQLLIYPGNEGTYGPPQSFPAGNNTIRPNGDPLTPDSFGPAPNGTFGVGPFTPKSGGPNGSYGSGIFHFDIPQRPGIGLHAGRENLGGPNYNTKGCIRTTESALDALRSDLPTIITIGH